MRDGERATETGPAHLFAGVATALISDNLERLPGAIGLRPFHKGGAMAGPAFTVRTAAGDNRAIHQALDAFQPGDVLVIDGGGDTSRALVGEIIAEIACKRGAAGSSSMARSGMPVPCPVRNSPSLPAPRSIAVPTKRSW